MYCCIVVFALGHVSNRAITHISHFCLSMIFDYCGKCKTKTAENASEQQQIKKVHADFSPKQISFFLLNQFNKTHNEGDHIKTWCAGLCPDIANWKLFIGTFLTGAITMQSTSITQSPCIFHITTPLAKLFLPVCLYYSYSYTCDLTCGNWYMASIKSFDAC